MSTIQDVIGDYTPLSNNVVKVLKLIKGAVACKIFFTSNLEDRICRMGLTRIANELGIDRSTASKSITALVKEEYVERVKDSTPTTPAHYRCTQKFYDLAGGVDVINRGVDYINQEEEVKEEVKELSSTNVEDAAQNKKAVNELNDKVSERDETIKAMQEQIDALQTTLELPNKEPNPLTEKKPKQKVSPPPAKKEIPPAVTVYRQNAGTFPNKMIFSDIDTAVGNDPDDLEFWGVVVKNYIMCGWYKGSVKTMLKYYNRREIPGDEKPNGAKTNGRNKKPNPTVDFQAEIAAANAELHL